MEYKLKILGESPRTSRHSRVVAQCICGDIKTYEKRNLSSGNTTSCGCKKMVALEARNTTHGLSRTPLYSAWVSMIQRCANPKRNNWERYGGRGIIVCEEWKTFANFYADMGERPEGKQLDRIDNNKGYSPSNCRWVTPKENSNNQEKTIKVEIGFFPLTIAQLAELALVSHSIMCRRWHKYGNAIDCLFPHFQARRKKSTPPTTYL